MSVAVTGVRTACNLLQLGFEPETVLGDYFLAGFQPRSNLHDDIVNQAKAHRPWLETVIGVYKNGRFVIQVLNDGLILRAF